MDIRSQVSPRQSQLHKEEKINNQFDLFNERMIPSNLPDKGVSHSQGYSQQPHTLFQSKNLAQSEVYYPKEAQQVFPGKINLKHTQTSEINEIPSPLFRKIDSDSQVYLPNQQAQGRILPQPEDQYQNNSQPLRGRLGAPSQITTQLESQSYPTEKLDAESEIFYQKGPTSRSSAQDAAFTQPISHDQRDAPLLVQRKHSPNSNQHVQFKLPNQPSNDLFSQLHLVSDHYNKKIHPQKTTPKSSNTPTQPKPRTPEQSNNVSLIQASTTSRELSPQKSILKRLEASNYQSTSQLQAPSESQSIIIPERRSTHEAEPSQFQRPQELEGVNMDRINYVLSTSSPRLSLQRQESELLNINLDNYFHKDCPNKLLHFFEGGTKNLYIIPLDDLETGNAQCHKIQLNIMATIPFRHRSLITPFGEIFLSGGMRGEEELAYLNKFNYSNGSMLPKRLMINSRKSHGFCYMAGYLYAIGGYNDKEGPLAFCER